VKVIGWVSREPIGIGCGTCDPIR